MESIDDILREMRSSPLSWLTPHQIPQMSHDNEELKKYADRIERAHKAELTKNYIRGVREGVQDFATKMRGTIKKVVSEYGIPKEIRNGND